MSFTGEWTYDVFLSFRGEDTRTDFTGHLYKYLDQKGIRAFRDDVDLQRGEEITPSLVNAIQQSRSAIIVFSENYASSTFCLDELVNILHYVKAEGRLVWPVFYGVDPSEVRHQRGNYGEALAKHEDRFQENNEKVRKWREALCVAANLSGWHFQHGSQPEYKFISGIIEEVSKKINRAPLHIPDHSVGLESSVRDVISLLGLGSDKGVSMVGIYGIGGVGKTTVARAVYNVIGDQFEGLCFLADIREKAMNKHGLVQLQETLLSEVIAENNLRLGDVHRGIPIIKRRLCRKKVLLILDDIDQLKQLQALAGRPDWFGLGSRIIVTTRDKHLLTTHGVENLYEVKVLNVNKSLELLSWNAFKNNIVDPVYVNVSNRAVFYAGGLPLALEIIGSNLFGRTVEECNSLLDKYESIPDKEVHEILKVSYDSLQDNEKQVFLDIACFFNKSELSYIKGMLYAHGLHEDIGIRVLIDKSLIKIDDSNCVRMHDLIEHMGREIVRQESTFEPGKRSRLWFDEDIVRVLEENTGTEKIEVIVLRSCKDKEVQWSGVGFDKMKNLRILIIENACFSRGPGYLPNALRVLDWSGYPSSSLPSDFKPKKLVILSLPEGCLRILEPPKVFHSLCLLDFEGCKFLTRVPNLSGLPNLGALCFDNCTKLTSVHKSVGFLDKLRLLSAQGCTELEMLVFRINLTSLETLDLTGCSSLWIFPEVLGLMENIRDIYLDQTAIRELPFSFGNLIGLKWLYLRHVERLKQLPRSIVMIPKLEVMLAYGNRGFRLFRGCEILVKQRSEVSLAVDFPYSLQDGRGSRASSGLFDNYLNGYCISKSDTNFIEMFTLQGTFVGFVLLPWSARKGCFGFLPVEENQGEMLRAFYSRRSSSVSFWFREKFPKVAICVIGESVEGLILDLRLRVFLNGSEQLICLCNYIAPQRSEKLIIWCGLRCKHERVISTDRWNHVCVSWELRFHKPHDPCRVISDDNEIPKLKIWLSGIHVYEEENSSTENIRFTKPDISVSQVEMLRSCYSIFYSPLDLSMDRLIKLPIQINDILRMSIILSGYEVDDSIGLIDLGMELPLLSFKELRTEYVMYDNSRQLLTSTRSILRLRRWRVAIAGLASSSNFTGEWKYDVFLSFIGAESRSSNFIEILCNSLNQKGIRTFINDVSRQSGQEIITPDIINAIRQSRIAIVVFLPEHRSSTVFHDVLANILEYIEGEGRLVRRLFFVDDPPDMWHYDDRFQANDDDKQSQRRKGLLAAARSFGWHYLHGTEYDHEFVSEIVEDVSKKINRPLLHVANHPVGLESTVQEVISLLELGSDEGVNMVGIYGIGGVGKTTVARAVYNVIGDQFEGVCFLADIREKAINKHGLVQLQETLLSELVAEDNLRLGDVHKGIPTIKRMLCVRKVLLILDDIDMLKQLQAIAGGPDWFGFGSRIIITTRNIHLLTTHGVKKLYEVKELNANKSLELLSWNAFKNNKVDPGYIDVANRAVSYAGGLPLSLKVIGSNLFSKRIEEWNSLLDKYERIPHREVHEILKVSDDSYSFRGEWTYNVFLSFRGEDTRNNFTGRLYNSLNQKDIITFIDDVNLQRGEEITPSLLNAIQQSRVAIIVFSENYASSTFCLDELVNILRYVKGEGRFVWPVFYGVDPSEVRHQRGSYGKALEKHKDRFQDNKEKVSNWREALCVAANLSGWHYQHGSQPEYKFIDEIIEEVSKKINRIPSN